MANEYREIEYAFPVPPGCGGNKGMTLRDYFAAKALVGVTAIDMLQHATTEEDVQNEITNAAALSYRLADAMLEARK